MRIARRVLVLSFGMSGADIKDGRPWPYSAGTPMHCAGRSVLPMTRQFNKRLRRTEQVEPLACGIRAPGERRAVVADSAAIRLSFPLPAGRLAMQRADTGVAGGRAGPVRGLPPSAGLN